MSHWIETLEETHVREVHALMKAQWWCAERSLDDVRRIVAGSDLILARLNEHGSVVAFMRVLSDWVFKAILFDVIVRPDYRDSGLGRELVEYGMSHPKLVEVKSVELYCPDHISGFYKSLGFSVSESKLHCFGRS